MTNEERWIKSTLDDTLENIYYQMTMDTELSTDEIKGLIELALAELGYGNHEV